LEAVTFASAAPMLLPGACAHGATVIGLPAPPAPPPDVKPPLGPLGSPRGPTPATLSSPLPGFQPAGCAHGATPVIVTGGCFVGGAD
jgi:hypothetical protein